MPPVEIKDGAQLNTVLSETTDTVEGLKAQNEEQGTALKALTDVIAQAKVDAAAMLEQIKTLTFANKAKGSWKEQNTSDAIAYKMGAYVQALVETGRGSRVGLGKLGELGVSRVHDDAFGKKEEIVMGGDEVKAGLSSSPLTGDDSVGSYNGSYTVPVEYNGEVLRVALDNSAMMPLVRQVPVPAITAYYPTTTDELAFTKLTNQNTDKTEDNITFGRATLTTEIYAAYVAIVEEFEEDSLVAVGALVRDMFGEAWGKRFDNLALRDSTYGAMATSDILEDVMSESGFANLTIDYLNDMIPNLNTQAKRSGARYYMHVTNWDTVESLKDSEGNYLLRQPADGAPLRMKGYPVTLSDGMIDLASSAASTSFVAFGNPKYILSGTRVPFEFRVYDQTQSNMESGQVFLRCRVRQAMVLSIPTAWVKLTTSS